MLESRRRAADGDAAAKRGESVAPLGCQIPFFYRGDKRGRRRERGWEGGRMRGKGGGLRMRE